MQFQLNVLLKSVPTTFTQIWSDKWGVLLKYGPTTFALTSIGNPKKPNMDLFRTRIFMVLVDQMGSNWSHLVAKADPGSVPRDTKVSHGGTQSGLAINTN